MEDKLNARIDKAINLMKIGNPAQRKKANEEYDKLTQERAKLARQKFYERHSTGKLKDL